jgi:hypothetical protein
MIMIPNDGVVDGCKWLVHCLLSGTNAADQRHIITNATKSATIGGITTPITSTTGSGSEWSGRDVHTSGSMDSIRTAAPPIITDPLFSSSSSTRSRRSSSDSGPSSGRPRFD